MPTRPSPRRAPPATGRPNEADLAALREAIARVDADFVRLFARRLDLARRIGRIKRDHDLPVQDFRVEKLVMARNRRHALAAGLAPETADELSRLLIGHAVRAQDSDRRLPSRVRVQRGERVLVVGGLGGMGRWMARYFDSLGHQVAVLDRPSVTRRAEFPRVRDLEKAAAGHSIIILATPIDETPSLLERITRTRTPALIFDVCSLKGPLRGPIAGAIARGRRVASIHPMFGPEAKVLAGRNILLCRTRRRDLSEEAGRFFERTTANLVSVPIERHDELMGCVLGLSHLTSLIYARALATSGFSFAQLRKIGSTTFAAQTAVSRMVSAENQDLYFEIQADSVETPNVLARFAAALGEYGDAIARSDRRRFKILMESARRYFEEGAPSRTRKRTQRVGSV